MCAPAAAAWGVARMGLTVLELSARALSAAQAATAAHGHCASAPSSTPMPVLGAAPTLKVAAGDVHGLVSDRMPQATVTIARAALRCKTSWLENDVASLDAASGDDGQSGLSLSMMVDGGTCPQVLGWLLDWAQQPDHCLHRDSVDALRAALATPSPEQAWLEARAQAGGGPHYQAAMRRISAVVRIAAFIGNVLPQLARGLGEAGAAVRREDGDGAAH